MKRYLVDGYNLLHSWRERRVFLSSGFEAAKEEMLRMLQKMADFEDIGIEVYFDAFRGPEVQAEKSGRLKVLYASGETSADMVIEREAYNAAKKEAMIVVTSDMGIKNLVRALGVLVVGPDQFLAEVSDCIKEINELIKKQNRR
ncbi:MAG: NYN domain-containing protein [Candidatus Aureabacteria bacterium]|nr:NYN domain-containing protein [Candidatus Auribacterota bacterium]